MLSFRTFVGVLVGVSAVNAIVSDFKGLAREPLRSAWRSFPRGFSPSVLASLGALLPSVMGELLRVYPCPITRAFLF